MISLEDMARVMLIGVGATAVMDLWLLGLKRLGIRAADFALIGRWMGHLAQGRSTRAGIAMAAPVPYELALGWLIHYAVGIAYAGLLVATQGPDWARTPTLGPALATGLATVVMPLFVMQPSMGLGVAGARTPAPLMNVIRSLANHAAYGVGLFVAAVLLGWVA